MKLLQRFLTSITPIVLVCIPSLASCSSETREYNILAFGDSLTAGYQVPITQSYPALLELLLKEKKFKAKITNAGVSGETSAQALRRVDWTLSQAKHDIVLLCIGANDGLRQLPVKDLEANLEKIIDKFQEKEIKVLLIGMKLPTNLFRNYRVDFEKAFSNVATKKKVPFMPFLIEGVAANPKLNLDDQIHPNTEGYKIVAKTVFDFLRDHLK